MADKDDGLQASDPKMGYLMTSKAKRARKVPGAIDGYVSTDVPETPLPTALQTPSVKTLEDARGVLESRAGAKAGGSQWNGDGTGSHWSNH